MFTLEIINKNEYGFFNVFATEAKYLESALAVAREECKWESTVQVVIRDKHGLIVFNRKGDFATLHIK